MENVIEKIIDIDKKAMDIKSNTEKMIKESGLKLNKKLSEIEHKEIMKAKEIGKKRYEKILKMGQNKRNEIDSAAKRECMRLEENFLKIHKKLGKQIFNDLFLNDTKVSKLNL